MTPPLAPPPATLPQAVRWKVASPETLGAWSAVCYYFATDLQRQFGPAGPFEIDIEGER